MRFQRIDCRRSLGFVRRDVEFQSIWRCLSQNPPRSYIIGPGDILSVYIEGFLPPNIDDVTPILQNNVALQNEYYPPTGVVIGPTAGVPWKSADDGTIPIPVIGSVKVEGLTIQQAADKLIKDVVDKKIVLKDREYLYINLVRPRVHRVMIVREEIKSDAPTIMPRQASIAAKRGSAKIVDLPAFENDILHALTASGGMPGTDAINEVWILRRGQRGDMATDEVWSTVEQCSNPPSSSLAAQRGDGQTNSTMDSRWVHTMLLAGRCSVAGRRYCLPSSPLAHFLVRESKCIIVMLWVMARDGEVARLEHQ